MSIASAIQNAQQKIANAYTAISNMGGTLPATQDLSNMPTAIASIPTGGGKVANFTIVGNPEINGGVARGFTASDYVTFTLTNVPSTITSYEMIFRANTMYNDNYPQGVSAQFSNNAIGHALGTNRGDYLTTWCSTNQNSVSAFSVNGFFVTTSSQSTKGIVGNFYWIRLTTGNVYEIIADNNYTIDNLPTSGWSTGTSAVFGGVDGTFFENNITYYIGRNSDSNYPNQIWNGEIDLNNFRFKVNGDIIYEAYSNS